jgi:hypothetical protein
MPAMGVTLAQAAASEVTTAGEASKVAQLDAFRLDDELVAIVMDQVNHVMTETPPVLRGFLSVRVFATQQSYSLLVQIKSLLLQLFQCARASSRDDAFDCRYIWGS